MKVVVVVVVVRCWTQNTQCCDTRRARMSRYHIFWVAPKTTLNTWGLQPVGGSHCLCACATTFARYGSAALPGLGGSWRHHGPSRDLSTACSIGRSEGKVQDSLTFWRKKWSAASLWRNVAVLAVEIIVPPFRNWPNTQSISQTLWAISHLGNSKIQVTLKFGFFHDNAECKSSDNESTLQHFRSQRASSACKTTWSATQQVFMGFLPRHSSFSVCLCFFFDMVNKARCLPCDFFF